MLDLWADRLTPLRLRKNLGAQAVQRGAEYAEDGRVAAVRTQQGGARLIGTVQGGATSPYRTVVDVDGATGWRSSCSCPLGGDCKHVAALLIAVRETMTDGPVENTAESTGRAGPAPWERALGPVLSTEAARSAATGVPLALLVDITVVQPGRRTIGGPRAGSELIRLRPAVPGRSSPWVRSGISWQGVQYDAGRSGWNPRHVRALRSLLTGHQLSGGTSWYSHSGDVHLNDFDRLLWQLLDEVQDAGVALVAADKGIGEIVLAREPAQLALDLTRQSARAGLVVAPTLSIGTMTVATSDAVLLGDPVHGVAVSVRQQAGTGVVPGLVLARLAAPLPASMTSLVTGGKPLKVPAHDIARFVRDWYPALRRVVAVTSGDDSVTLPEIVPPVLALDVGYHPGSEVRLQWSVQYQVGDGVRRTPLRHPDEPAPPEADEAAETALVRALPAALEEVPRIRTTSVRGWPSPLLRLTALDAVLFTDRVLPALQAADAVEVTVTGEVPDYRHVTEAPQIAFAATDSADPDWFDLGVTVTVGEEEVPFVELFQALATDQSHLILTSGTWFALDRPEFEQLRRLIEEARELADDDQPGLRISRFQVGLWDELAELGVVSEQSERWSRQVRGLLDVDTKTPPPLPAGLAAQLRPYQVQGYSWLSFLWDHELGGVLADDMGLGKTLQALALFCRAHEAGELDDAPVLVVAPTSVVSNWAREAAKFAPGLRVVSVDSTDRRRALPLAEHVAGAHVVLTSYALFRIEEQAYQALPWRGLVLDEAQFVKNHQAKTYQCARLLPAPFKLAITGTPLENSLMDLWSLLSITAPGLWPDPQLFTETYRNPIERAQDAEKLVALRRRIRPLMRRRTKEMVATELPPKQEQVLEVALNPRHEKIYQTHLQQERKKVLGMVGDLQKNRFAIFRSLTLLRQLALDPGLVDEKYAAVPSSKADAFLDQLTEVVAEGHRALVFSQFTGFLKIIRARLDAAGIPYAYLDGRTRNRADRIAEFTDGGAPVFLISLKAGGFGLNLTQADYVFVLDPWWNPAAEAQAVDRTHRIGQDKTVMVYRLVATGTIEEKVMALKARKQNLFDRVIDEDALMSGPLSAEDIRGLFD